ncbi:MAG: host attachment protein [Steroidobacteraceae bacterium]
MRTRIVVADRSEARFYEVTHGDSQLELVGELTDPQARLRDRDYKSDRPGRVYDRAASGTRRGATAHHDTSGEKKPHKHEAEVFAKRIADALLEGQHDRQFDRLVLMAAPAFLGQLRSVLPQALGAAVILEVNKDLVHEDERAIGAHLPQDVLTSAK